ncbi:Fungal specific transcription factor domain [Ceratobasidium sp. AG-Ba]|nr:Fungal specific transcription factor domain [Ceratobasidium sp. AG-Ba]
MSGVFKCDGKTPVCSLCEKNGYECIYDARLDQRRPAQKNYVAALEARVELLENILKNSGAGDALRALDLANENPQAEQDAGFVPADDAANVVESLSLVAPEQPAGDPGDFDLGMSSYVPLVSLQAEHDLLAQFWDWQRMHLPYVPPVPFLAAYAMCSETAHPEEPIPPPPSTPDPAVPNPLRVPRAEEVQPAADLIQFISPLLLDAVFAIAALFHGNLETSERFYRRAEARVLSEAANPRLATVQAMLIMATWELGHARAPATWTLLGVTCALAIRLGMHLDATPLLRSGVMAQRVFEARNFVFWAIYNKDRFCGICMGMHPLIDRRMITTPRHSSLPVDSAGVVKQDPNQDANVAWWDPRILGLGDMMNQAGWEATRDLIRLTDTLFEGIYSFDAPKRTPEQDLNLVTSNNLTIQRFLDEMPAWLRSTGVMRKKENGLVYLHLFTHLSSIVASRPFLSPRPIPEEVRRVDATLDPSQPNHSSHIIRRYRTLAFRVARASALQTIGLVRHIPLSSPCVTLPYVVYSACTILLLAPDDPKAMDSVRTGIACLESLDESGYWVVTARDAKERILALARRWGVNIESEKKVLGHLGPGGSGAGGSAGAGSGAGGPSGSGTGGSGSSGSNNKGASGSSGAQMGSSNSTTNPSTAGGSRSRAAPGDHGDGVPLGGQSMPAHVLPLHNPEPSSSQVQGYPETSNHGYTSSYSKKAELSQGDAPPSYDDVVAPQAYGRSGEPQGYGSTSSANYFGAGIIPSQMAQPAPVQVYEQPQQTAYLGQYPTQYQFQQPIQVHYHIHTHSHSHHHQHVHQYQPTTYTNPHYSTQHQRHVGYANSHGDPRHDFGVPHQHWHEILPAPGPAEEFPPDPIACSDVAECFRGTVQTTQDPAFVNNMSDPYSGLAVDWFANAQDGFALITPDMYGKGVPFTAGGGMPGADPGYSGGV